jgi:nitroreductase
MNPVVEAINNRTSVRSYKADPVPKSIINTIIEAGNQAPSKGRQEKRSPEFLFQPWRLVVVEDQEFKQTLVQTTLLSEKT